MVSTSIVQILANQRRRNPTLTELQREQLLARQRCVVPLFVVLRSFTTLVCWVLVSCVIARSEIEEQQQMVDIRRRDLSRLERTISFLTQAVPETTKVSARATRLSLIVLVCAGRT